MFVKGRICIKLAGRDAGKQCVVVEEIDDKFVTIDGLTRRRKCNKSHLEPTEEIMSLKSGAHEEIVEAFKKVGIEIKEKKSKPATERPRQKRTADKKSKK